MWHMSISQAACGCLPEREPHVAFYDGKKQHMREREQEPHVARKKPFAERKSEERGPHVAFFVGRIEEQGAACGIFFFMVI